MERILLTENEQFNYEVIQENNNYYLTGIFQESEIKNSNKRIYPRHILEREINKLQPLVRERRLKGELGHPNSPEINLERVCILIEQLNFIDNKVSGRARILEALPYGQILKSYADYKIPLGISARGMGSLINKGDTFIVDENYSLITYDIVDNPGFSTAFLKVVKESYENEYKKITFGEIIEDFLEKKIKEDINPVFILEYNGNTFNVDIKGNIRENENIKLIGIIWNGKEIGLKDLEFLLEKENLIYCIPILEYKNILLKSGFGLIKKVRIDK